MRLGLRFDLGITQRDFSVLSRQIERLEGVLSWLLRAFVRPEGRSPMFAIHQRDPRSVRLRRETRGSAARARQEEPAHRFSRVALPQLDARRRAAMLELARRSSPHVDIESYLLPRLEDYDFVISIEHGSRLVAFELVQEFESAGERYVYLGPLFSREGACVPLFSAFFDSLLGDTSGAPFHLLAEAQSPRVALLFKRMFLRSSYPRLSDGWIPERAREVAREFGRHLPHIGAIELTNLSSRSERSMFRAPGEYAPVVEWMARRGVDLARGDSQLLIVTCDGSLAARAALRVEAWLGERALSASQACKRRMLERFDRGAR
jgi:hypothetical protein